MNTIPRLAAGAVALLALAACQNPGPQPAAAAPAASAASPEAVENVDLGAITCAQALADEKLFNSAMLWADGYAHGRLGRAPTRGSELTDHKPQVVAQCQRDMSRRLVDVVVQLNRRPRR